MARRPVGPNPTRSPALKIALGAAAGVLAVVFLRTLPLSGLALFEILVLGLIALWLVLAVHESGHLLAGSLSRFRMLSFTAGPLQITRRGERFVIGMSRSIAPWSGFVAFVPTSTERLRRRMTWIAGGGPMASLFSGTAALLGWHLLRTGDAAASTPAAGLAFLYLFAVGSFLVAATTLWPGSVSQYRTDGARMLALIRGGPEVEQEMAILTLSAMSFGGTRPGDWDAELVRRALGSEDSIPHGSTGRQLAFAYALDSGRVQEAREHLRLLLSRRDVLPDAELPGLLLQAARFFAFQDRDLSRARTLLADAAATGDWLFVAEHERPLTEAAIELMEGDAERALLLLGQAQDALAMHHDRGEVLAVADQIKALANAAVEVG